MKTSKEKKALIKQLIEEYDIKDSTDITNMIKDLMGNTIGEMLNSELDEELGYDKHDMKNKQTINSRNAFSSKTMRSDFGDVELQIPRDRDGDFEPQIVKSIKRNSEISNNKSSLYMPKG